VKILSARVVPARALHRALSRPPCTQICDLGARVHRSPTVSVTRLQVCQQGVSLSAVKKFEMTKHLPSNSRKRPVVIMPASRRAWAACRAARRPKGGVTPPTPRWSARENSGRRSYRWQQRHIRESLHPPSRQWSRTPDRSERSLSALRVHAVALPSKVICSRRKRA
jgi:hypothetical protein